MIKKISLLVLCLIMAFGWAAPARKKTAVRKKSPEVNLRALREEQRLDEYALSERRRDWLKDRLILQIGAGSRFFSSGVGLPSFGFGAEYITKWHLAPFASYGVITPRNDPSFEYTREGGAGYKFGVNYYLFPKLPMHLGLGLSYGTVFFDWQNQPDEITPVGGGDPTVVIPKQYEDAKIYYAKGYQAELLISYLSDKWYYLNVSLGAAYNGPDLPYTSDGGSKVFDGDLGEYISLTPTSDSEQRGIKDLHFVWGISIGFALPDMFPDETEVRRRQREAERRRRE